MCVRGNYFCVLAIVVAVSGCHASEANHDGSDETVFFNFQVQEADVFAVRETLEVVNETSLQGQDVCYQSRFETDELWQLESPEDHSVDRLTQKQRVIVTSNILVDSEPLRDAKVVFDSAGKLSEGDAAASLRSGICLQIGLSLEGVLTTRPATDSPAIDMPTGFFAEPTFWARHYDLPPLPESARVGDCWDDLQTFTFSDCQCRWRSSCSFERMEEREGTKVAIISVSGTVSCNEFYSGEPVSKLFRSSSVFDLEAGFFRSSELTVEYSCESGHPVMQEGGHTSVSLRREWKRRTGIDSIAVAKNAADTLWNDQNEFLELVLDDDSLAGYLRRHAASRLTEWKQLSEVGNPVARFFHAQCLRHGIETDKDVEGAVAVLKKSANQGYAPAQYELAKCLRDGAGCPVDMVASADLLLKAAKQGYGPAVAVVAAVGGTSLTRRQPRFGAPTFRKTPYQQLVEDQEYADEMFLRQQELQYQRAEDLRYEQYP